MGFIAAGPASQGQSRSDEWLFIPDSFLLDVSDSRPLLTLRAEDDMGRWAGRGVNMENVSGWFEIKH